ncbi:MAG: hypothetical protein WCS43_17145 [Verrucomicrobiota bacterium]
MTIIRETAAENVAASAELALHSIGVTAIVREQNCLGASSATQTLNSGRVH